MRKLEEKRDGIKRKTPQTRSNQKESLPNFAQVISMEFLSYPESVMAQFELKLQEFQFMCRTPMPPAARRTPPAHAGGTAAAPRRASAHRTPPAPRKPAAGHARAGRAPHGRTRRAAMPAPRSGTSSAGPRSAMRRRRSRSTLYRSRRRPRRRGSNRQAWCRCGGGA